MHSLGISFLCLGVAALAIGYLVLSFAPWPVQSGLGASLSVTRFEAKIKSKSAKDALPSRVESRWWDNLEDGRDLLLDEEGGGTKIVLEYADVKVEDELTAVGGWLITSRAFQFFPRGSLRAARAGPYPTASSLAQLLAYEHEFRYVKRHRGHYRFCEGHGTPQRADAPVIGMPPTGCHVWLTKLGVKTALVGQYAFKACTDTTNGIAADACAASCTAGSCGRSKSSMSRSATAIRT